MVFDIERRGKACSISRDAKDDAKRAKTRNANGGGKYRFLFEPLLEFSFDRGWRMRGDGIFRDGVPRNGPPSNCLKDFEMDRIANIKAGWLSKREDVCRLVLNWMSMFDRRLSFRSKRRRINSWRSKFWDEKIVFVCKWIDDNG